MNKAGNVVVANGNSVTYAVMERGGSLNNRLNAILADGASANVWPLTGYTYLIVRLRKHLGTCAERKAALQYLYNFYYSDAVTEIALQLNYATLPSFIRNIVVGKLINNAQCNDGTYALAQYQTSELSVYCAEGMANPMSTYLSAYYIIDPTTTWNLTHVDNSDHIWQAFVNNPASAIAGMTMFPSKKTKLDRYTSVSNGNVVVSAFAHVALVPLYHVNAFTSKATSPLRITAEILAGIYSGKIRYWNDTLLQLANMENRMYLPFQRIQIVVRSNASDANQIFTRYLARHSPTFASLYGIAGDDGSRYLNYQTVLANNSPLKIATDNTHVDSFVTFFDNSIGYYLMNVIPVSSVALFCTDSACKHIVSPTAKSSILACEADNGTVVTNGVNINTYDLMASNATGCYPLIGTYDYAVYVDNDVASCAVGDGGVAHQRVRLGAWLFNGTSMIQPLEALSIAGSPNTLRYQTQQKICQIKCPSSLNTDRYLGYDYCQYRDCSWTSHDYIQVVSECHADTEHRRVTYVLKEGNTCIQNPNTIPKSPVYITCDYVMSGSTTGIVCYTLGCFGAFLSLFLLVMAYLMRKDRKFKKMQPIFVDVFLVGAIITNSTVIPYIGPNTNTSCLLRPWLYNVALTIMYGPLVMKLYTVDKFVNSNRIKKDSKASEKLIFLEVGGMLCVDAIILGVWTFLQPPRQKISYTSYPSVYAAVEDHVCTAGSVWQYIIVAYKVLMLGVGMFKAVTTWHVTADISEAKQFSVALAVGGIAYLMVVFVTFSGNSTVFMSCIGIFLSGTMSVCLIMIPKFMRRRNAVMKVHPSAHPGGSSGHGLSSHHVGASGHSGHASGYLGDPNGSQHGSNLDGVTVRRKSFSLFHPQTARRGSEPKVECDQKGSHDGKGSHGKKQEAKREDFEFKGVLEHKVEKYDQKYEELEIDHAGNNNSSLFFTRVSNGPSRYDASHTSNNRMSSSNTRSGHERATDDVPLFSTKASSGNQSSNPSVNKNNSNSMIITAFPEPNSVTELVTMPTSGLGHGATNGSIVLPTFKPSYGGNDGFTPKGEE